MRGVECQGLIVPHPAVPPPLRRATQEATCHWLHAGQARRDRKGESERETWKKYQNP